jgi:hypothetical protein
MSKPRQSMTLELVTPKMAERYLSKNVGNRKVKDSHVRRMSRDADSGSFFCTHHAIAFDTDGVLRDGQHRLMMIIATGIPQWLWVCRGINADSLVHIDGGVPRSIRDAIQMASKNGELASNAEIAVAKSYELMPDMNGYPYSRREVIRILQQGADPISGSCERSFLGFTKGTKVVIARALSACPEQEDRIKDFVNVLFNGQPVSEKSVHDSSAICYRNYLMSQIGHSGNRTEVDRYKKGQLALQYFIDRSKVIKCFGSKDDLFPLPDSWDPVAVF